MSADMSTLCPLLLQGMVGNAAFLKASEADRTKYMTACVCQESKCGFWTEIGPHGDADTDEDADEDAGEVVEACGVSLLPSMLADAVSSVSDVGDAVESLHEVSAATHKLLEIAAFAAASQFDINLESVMENAQAMAAQMEASSEGAETDDE